MSQPVSTKSPDASKVASSDKPRLELVKDKDSVQNLSLLATIGKMTDSLQIMIDIIQKANFIAVSAAIEAARTQTQSENFTLVADQVRRQAEKTEELAADLRREIAQLEICAMRAKAVRFADIASDLIDKVDRNLFERNCDCQAWAGFEEILHVANISQGKKSAFIRQVKDATEDAESVEILQSIATASEVLQRLCKTYQVYLEVTVCNNLGIVVASANDGQLIGDDCTRTLWFSSVMKNSSVYVSEVHLSETVGQLTVSYSAPIKGSDGGVVGVLTTRFNWSYAQEMLDTLPVNQNTRLFLINSEGTLLAKKPQGGILADNMAWLLAGEGAITGQSGFSIESARNGQLNAWGFCHTYGFAGYPGKKWSAIVCNPINSRNRDLLFESIKRDGEANRQAADLANSALQDVTNNISSVVGRINSINNETNMLAVNAAIQAGVAGAEGESFSVIASEIGKLSKQSEDFVLTINQLTETLGKSVSQTIFTRLGEAAFDTIDKIDRNLFERYCDIQAFAAFKLLKDFLTQSGDAAAVQDLLLRLHAIYEVYHDILLLNLDGVIVASAKHRELVGQSQRDRDWFREASTNKIVVTDFYHSNSINDYTVTFASPVLSDAGKVVGVMSTRFNCKFIYDIMKSTIVGRGSQVYLTNQKGFIIGSTVNANILKDSLNNLKAYRALESSKNGYELEYVDGRLAEAVGYAKGKGYLNYQGKGWSVLIRRDLNEQK